MHIGYLKAEMSLDTFIKIWTSRNLTVIFVVIYLFWLGLGSLYGYKDYRLTNYYPAKIVLIKTKETTLSVEGLAKPQLLRHYLRKTEFSRRIKLNFITTSEKYNQLKLVLGVRRVNLKKGDLLEIIDNAKRKIGKVFMRHKDKNVKLTIPINKKKNIYFINSTGRVRIRVISYKLE